MTTDRQEEQDQAGDRGRVVRATTTRTFWLAERARSSPYYPALSHPVIRRVLPGAAASALGDGMSAVAIAWLALKLAPADSRRLWVGAAVVLARAHSATRKPGTSG